MFLAPTPLRLDEPVEIFLSIVIRELGPGFDTFTGKDKYLTVRADGFAVRPAGVIDVPRPIGGDIPVDRFPCAHIKEIFAVTILRVFFAKDAAGVFDDADAARDIFFGEKPFAGQRTAHGKAIPSWGVFGNAFFHLLGVSLNIQEFEPSYN